MRMSTGHFGGALLASALGLFVASSAAAQVTEIYTYDALGRVTQINYSNGAVIKYTYDAAGNRTQVSGTAAPTSTKVVVVPLLGGLVIPLH